MTTVGPSTGGTGGTLLKRSMTTFGEKDRTRRPRSSGPLQAGMAAILARENIRRTDNDALLQQIKAKPHKSITSLGCNELEGGSHVSHQLATSSRILPDPDKRGGNHS